MCFETECEICAARGGAQELLGELKKRGRVLRSRLRSKRTSSSSSRIVRRRPRRRTIVVGANPTFFWPPWMNLAPMPAPSNPSVAPTPGGSAADLPPEEPAAAEPEPANEPEPAGDGAVDSGADSGAVEEEVVRQGLHARISWRKLTLPGDLHRISNRPGIYIVTASGAPTYVGQSLRMRERWQDRLQGLKKVIQPIDVWFGELRAERGVPIMVALRAAEHAAIRLLVEKDEQGKPLDNLENRTSNNIFVVQPGGSRLLIEQALPIELASSAKIPKTYPAENFNQATARLKIEPGAPSPEYLSPWRARRP